MNRYQLEVAEMDRRHRLWVRTISFSFACVLAVVVLWSSGFAEQALQHARAWLVGADSKEQAPETAQQSTAALKTEVANSEKEESTATTASISRVSLPLYLLATFPGRNKHEGSARIGTDPWNPQTYTAGALLANGATLVEIHPDFVVLAKGDRTAKLTLRGSTHDAVNMSELLEVGGAADTKTAKATTVEAFTQYVRPSVVYDGDTIRGYEVYPGRKSGVFTQLGLQSGDLITAINDMPLAYPEQAIESFSQLTEGMAMTATIERNGRRERITLDGSLIVADRKDSDPRR